MNRKELLIKINDYLDDYNEDDTYFYIQIDQNYPNILQVHVVYK